jgi:hypothetical protein
MEEKHLLRSFFIIVPKLKLMLESHDFVQASPERTDLEMLLQRWTRSSQWKRDIVEMTAPKKGYGNLAYVQMHLDIRLKYGVDDMGLFNGTTVASVVGKKRPYYFLPRFPLALSFRTSRFMERVVHDTEKALSWFRLFSTPQECLTALKTGETTVGPIKDIGAARDAYNFLSSLV